RRPACPGRRRPSALRDAVDLDRDASGQGAGLDGGAGRMRRTEVGGVDLVHRLEVVDVLQVDVTAQDLVQRRAGRLEDRLHVVQRAPGLRRDVAQLELARLRVPGALAGDVDGVAVDDGLRVGSDGSGG